MDKGTLLNWKAELQKQLSELEASIVGLQIERLSVLKQLENIEALISSMEEPVVHDGASQAALARPLATHFFREDSMEIEHVWNGVLATINSSGWSVGNLTGKRKVFEVSKGDNIKSVRRKHSKYYEKLGDYWFGIKTDDLKTSATKEVGVILLLLGLDYVYFPIEKLSELLSAVRPSKIGNSEFHMKASGDKLSLYPSGTKEWIDVTSYRGTEGLKRLLD